MTVIDNVAIPASAARRPFRVSRLLRLVVELRRIRNNRADMRRLRAMDDWQLDDIGLTRADLAAACETSAAGDPTRALGTLYDRRRRVEEAARRVC